MRQVFRSKFTITQAFGVNADYYKQFGLKGHEGIDLIPTGTVWDILCLADGVVVKDEDNAKSGSYGIYLTVWHPTLNKATQYCHLASNYANLGDKVTSGQKIGLMGKTGNTTGPHLHLNLFNVDSNGVRLNRDNGYFGGIDPLPFLEEDNTSIDTVAVPKADFERLVTKATTLDNQKPIYEELKQQLEEARRNLEAEKKEKDELWKATTGFAQALGVAVSTEKIAGEIARLVHVEDENNVLKRSMEELKGELFKAEKTIQDQAKEQNEALQALQGLKIDLAEVEKALAEVKKEQEKTVLELDVCRKQRKDLDKWTTKELIVEIIKRITKRG